MSRLSVLCVILLASCLCFAAAANKKKSPAPQPVCEQEAIVLESQSPSFATSLDGIPLPDGFTAIELIPEESSIRVRRGEPCIPNTIDDDCMMMKGTTPMPTTMGTMAPTTTPPPVGPTGPPGPPGPPGRRGRKGKKGHKGDAGNINDLQGCKETKKKLQAVFFHGEKCRTREVHTYVECGELVNPYCNGPIIHKKKQLLCVATKFEKVLIPIWCPGMNKEKTKITEVDLPVECGCVAKSCNVSNKKKGSNAATTPSPKVTKKKKRSKAATTPSSKVTKKVHKIKRTPAERAAHKKAVAAKKRAASKKKMTPTTKKSVQNKKPVQKKKNPNKKKAASKKKTVHKKKKRVHKKKSRVHAATDGGSKPAFDPSAAGFGASDEEDSRIQRQLFRSLHSLGFP